MGNAGDPASAKVVLLTSTIAGDGRLSDDSSSGARNSGRSCSLGEGLGQADLPSCC